MFIERDGWMDAMRARVRSKQDESQPRGKEGSVGVLIFRSGDKCETNVLFSESGSQSNIILRAHV